MSFDQAALTKAVLVGASDSQRIGGYVLLDEIYFNSCNLALEVWLNALLAQKVKHCHNPRRLPCRTAFASNQPSQAPTMLISIAIILQKISQPTPYVNS